MFELLKDIVEIPEAAKVCLECNKNLELPNNVPYIGMGGSSFTALTLYYCGVSIIPEVASEYHLYRKNKIKIPKGVLISQSGMTSEVLWTAGSFKEIVAITNDVNSPLALANNVEQIVPLCAGEERALSATKTFINTLVVLYAGLGLNPGRALGELSKNFVSIREEAKAVAEVIAPLVKTASARYVVGSGPSMGAAMDGALVLSEVLKHSWQGISVGQYDHGPKETANNSVVILLDSFGPDHERIQKMEKNLKSHGAAVVTLKEKGVSPSFAPFLFLPRLYFLTNYLADELGINGDNIGGKVTLAEGSITKSR
jgi:glucosamine--fructose-6-phosphate aminotransferase (isomerizing)